MFAFVTSSKPCLAKHQVMNQFSALLVFSCLAPVSAAHLIVTATLVCTLASLQINKQNIHPVRTIFGRQYKIPINLTNGQM